ncbi:hypothetical protein FS749_005253 [Ceratobasidium sp. UAMH 11750]|nr:hypothetical protein FS749_005253 [Ceratobasidium sp. UAMH 11750]
MPPPASNYRKIFAFRGPEIGRPMSLALSPSSCWFCSGIDNGDFGTSSIRKSQSFHIDMGRLHYVTAITWVKDLQQIILGCADASVYMATFDIMSEHKIRFNKLFPAKSLIVALAYNRDRGRLAVGYSHDVFIWRCVDDPARWEQVNTLHVNLDGSLPSIKFLHSLDRIAPSLLEQRLAQLPFRIWSGGESLVLRETRPQVCRIGAAAFAPDNPIMAITTLDESVIIWPVAMQSIITTWPHVHALKSTAELGVSDPQHPIEVTHDRRVVCGTLDGSVIILSHNAQRLQTLTRRTLLFLSAIIKIHLSISNYRGSLSSIEFTAPAIIVVSFTDAIGVVTHVGYTNDKEAYDYHDKKRVNPEGKDSDARFYKFAELLKQSATARPNRIRSCVHECSIKTIMWIIILPIVVGIWIAARADEAARLVQDGAQYK